MSLSLLRALHLTNGFGLCSAHGSLWHKDDAFKPLEQCLSFFELAYNLLKNKLVCAQEARATV